MKIKFYTGFAFEFFPENRSDGGDDHANLTKNKTNLINNYRFLGR